MNRALSIYTDGGCLGNPGPGAWAWVATNGKDSWEASGFCPDTTNNRMELKAVIEALKAAAAGVPDDGKAAASVELFTDSKYVQQGITLWIEKWLKNTWRTASGDPVKNQDLWKELLALKNSLSVAWRWVKGHAGNELNERANSLVLKEMRTNTRESSG